MKHIKLIGAALAICLAPLVNASCALAEGLPEYHDGVSDAGCEDAGDAGPCEETEASMSTEAGWK